MEPENSDTDFAAMKSQVEDLWRRPNFPIGQNMFDFEDMKPEQVEILAHCLLERNVLGVLPTGYGKSFIYMSLPVFAQELWKPQMRGENRCVLVISPLKALIDSQCAMLKGRGLKTVALHEDSPKFEDAAHSSTQIILATPEILNIKKGESLLKSQHFRKRLVSIVFDEAHVVSEWGDEFRPKYRHITKLRVTLNKPVLLLTATCSETVYNALCDVFQFDELYHVAVIPNRPNIFLSIEGENAIDMKKALGWLAEELRQKRGSTPKTLIYVRDLSHIVLVRNIFAEICGDYMHHPDVVINEACLHKSSMVLPYFAGAGEVTKKQVLNDFSLYGDSTVRIVICTIAFGLGIDVPDIKRVVHWGAPKNAAAYLQEVGRAGRDNTAAEAFLYVVPLLLKDSKGADADHNAILRDYCQIKKSKRIVRYSKSTQTPGHNAASTVDSTVEEHVESQECWRKYLLQQVKLPFMRGTIPSCTPCTGRKDCQRYMCCSVCRRKCTCLRAKQPKWMFKVAALAVIAAIRLRLQSNQSFGELWFY